ncbi:MAG: hypothetical protein KDK99_00175 [Verrucomicrobiales bacterium]|nr:hypothetical protein [Verrucomicrobiales bacterium]
MSPVQHFILSLIGPLILTILMVIALNMAEPWLTERHIPVTLLLLPAAIIAWVATRYAVRLWVPVRCMHCGINAGYEMEGTSNRFMCRRCGRYS